MVEGSRPSRWSSRIARETEIVELAERLCETAKRQAQGPAGPRRRIRRISHFNRLVTSDGTRVSEAALGSDRIHG